uniref:Uncharacterized protein n=1 Tax=Toxoplasma gondii COUG TaxID=1074873 RepID=A0A2G8YE90_TOXGO|nr:hypothetical protein TGCOUG_391150 [Toxoplasma gondii COUG]
MALLGKSKSRKERDSSFFPFANAETRDRAETDRALSGVCTLETRLLLACASVTNRRRFFERRSFVLSVTGSSTHGGAACSFLSPVLLRRCSFATPVYHHPPTHSTRSVRTPRRACTPPYLCICACPFSCAACKEHRGE